MKLIIAILREPNEEPVSRALTSANFRVTYIASTGGLLHHGMTTLLIGVDDAQVETALDIIRKNCQPATEPDTRNATIFVVKVDEFTHF
jgi:uncharacterized protein YaaQ